MSRINGLYMSDTSISTYQRLCSAKPEDGEEKSYHCKGRLIALRTKAELRASLEITAAYIIKIPAKSASVALQYVRPQLLLSPD